jgi:hypothetical protein
MNKIKSAIVNILAELASRASGGQVSVIYQSPELVSAARTVIAAVDAEVANASSENKHARAYAKLRRLFPHLPNRMIGLAIELALR